MNIRVNLALLLTCLMAASSSYADDASPALFNSEVNPSKLGASVMAMKMERDVKLDDDRVASLESKQAMAGITYDLLPWLTASLCAGAADGRLDGLTDNDKYQFSWGLGLEATLWSIQIAPARVSLKGLAGFTQARLGNNVDVDWNEFTGAGTVQLDIFAKPDVADALSALGMSLYAGPVFSSIRGSVDDGIVKQDFREDQSFGILAGLDFTLTKTVSIGANAVWFDSDSKDSYTPTWGASFRYHF